MIKSVLKTNINSTAIKVGDKSFKSLKDGRVLIETGILEEAKLPSSTIRDNCGNDLEATVPKRRSPRMVIQIVLHDINVKNLEKTIMTQNRELGFIQGDIATEFSFRTKRGRVNMVIEVCSGTKKKLLHTKP